jgi:hypothetical protein
MALAHFGNSRYSGMSSNHFLDRRRGDDRRVDNDMQIGADRRTGVERRNGLAVLLAGCPECGRIAPPPAEMHSEGWLIVADDTGVKLIMCPDHRADSRPAAT